MTSLMPFFSSLGRSLHLIPRDPPSSIVRDVAYFTGSDAHVNHKLDIFLPQATSSKPSASFNDCGSEKKVPIIVHVHGGAWVWGSRTNEWQGPPTIGRACAREGFVGVLVSYRLARVSPTSFTAWAAIVGLILSAIAFHLRSWQLITGYVVLMMFAYAYNFLYRAQTHVHVEHMVDDICRALAYIRNHIQEHCPRADPDQVFISGHSAGAHLISLLVVDRSYFLRHHLSPAFIRGVISMSGVYSLANPVHDSANNYTNIIYRILYSSSLRYPEGKKMNEFSPIEYIKEDEALPSFLVMSARFDMGLEVDARRFVERLRRCHHQVEYRIIGGLTTHDRISSNFSENDAHRHFFNFIRQHAKLRSDRSMPATTAHLDSYNAGLDRLNTCIMSAVYSPDNTRFMASDDQGRLGLFHSSPHISSKPILFTTLTNGSHSQGSSTAATTANNNSVSLASSANEILIVVSGSISNGLVQGYRWSDITSNKTGKQLPSDVFSFDLARGPTETFVCVQAPSKKQHLQKANEIIVGSNTGTLRVLNIERQTLVTTVDAAHQGAIHQVAFANDGKRVASCSEDGTCKIWDLSSSSHQPIHTIETNKWISCCAFDMATDRLVIGGECPLTLWHLAMLSSSSKQKPLLVYNSIPTPIYALALCSGDDDTILVGGETNKLYSVPKNGDEQATMTISRPTTPSPIYTISTTAANNPSTKDNGEIKVVVAGSHWHIDSFTITESNIRKVGHYEFSK